jgi:myo-inositol-1(or 4)-monophosphatase
VGISGFPRAYPGWAQFRALGAASLDLCAVADGSLDGYRVAGCSTLAVWDYVGALLVCTEAGAVVAERDGLDLIVRDGSGRRPIAGATAPLLAQLAAAAL